MDKIIMVYMLLSKTFLRRSCKAYLGQLDVKALERVREALTRAEKTEVVPYWRHLCGAEPHEWQIVVSEDGKTVFFTGGIKWRAKLENGILYVDECVTKELLIEVIDEALRQASTLRCESWSR
jgi:hypothetical protein